MMRRWLALWVVAPVVIAVGQPTQVDAADPIRCLIITGDEGHDWKSTAPVIKAFLAEGDKIKVDVTETPAKDLTPENLARYDVLLLHYQDRGKGGPDTVWSEANMKAFLDAVKGGKGLVVYHYATAAFKKNEEFERAIGGGWRSQGFHGPSHVFKVRMAMDHPITRGMPREFTHNVDELYSNSVMFEGNHILATAWCDPAKPKGTGKHEAIVWVSKYGKGRVCTNLLGHDTESLANEQCRKLYRRCVEWAATGKVEKAK